MSATPRPTHNPNTENFRDVTAYPHVASRVAIKIARKAKAEGFEPLLPRFEADDPAVVP